jgi:opacity protein-like surface antigen
LGVELDFEYFRSAGSKNVASGDLCCAGSSLAIATSVSTDWLFTARPRLGFVQNNWLFYGTGGLAVSRLKASWNFTESSGPSFESASASVTKSGWTAGGGIETALPNNWLIGVEYLYVKFGSISANSTNLVAGGTPIPSEVFSHSADLNANIVRARLSKLF